IVYAAFLTVHHHPSASRDAGGRERCLIRNAIWLAWMRLPWRISLRDSLRVCRAGRGGAVLPALGDALRGMPWVLRKRRVLPAHALLLYRMLRG
ncbi:MAG: glycosyltransferase family 2 protein, partial [Burkholderiaceae bacterium]